MSYSPVNPGGSPSLGAEDAAAEGTSLASPDRICAAADVISLHAPLVPATRHVIDARRLAMMTQRVDRECRARRLDRRGGPGRCARGRTGFRTVAAASCADAVDKVAGPTGFPPAAFAPRINAKKIAGPAVTVLEGPTEEVLPPQHALDANVEVAMGDVDAVVAIPRDHAEAVLEMARDIDAREAEQARLITGSGSLRESLAKYGRI